MLTSIFTCMSISLGIRLRQCLNHYIFRAGENLPHNEFRYFKTLIVRAAVHLDFSRKLRLKTS